MNKRGQITVFIIIGILILFAFALVFFIYSSSVEKKEISASPIIEQVPTELNPLALFIEDCIRQTGERGLKVLGENGGYINPDDVGEYSYDNPTEADGILLGKNSNIKVPYWLYNKQKNPELSIQCDSLAPQLKREYNDDNSIESQLDRFMNKELGICINEFEAFKAQGFEIEAGEIDTTTTVTLNKVTFFVEYPLEIRGAAKAELKKFYTELDVPLNRMYSLAQELTNAEAGFQFIEETTLGLIESFSAVNANQLPPMTDSTFEFGKIVVWPVITVEENIKSMLSSYVPMFRVHQSVNYYRYIYPQSDPLADLKQRTYDNMIIDLEKAVPYKVKFDYLGWPIYLDANDNAGVIAPQSASVSYSGFNFGIQRYKTVYDLSYPVLVTIEDPNALNNKGYTFSFALESNIRNNRPAECGDILREPIVEFQESLICNDNQRNSAEYLISAEDNYNGDDLAGVQVIFTAGDESCFIGETASELAAQLPIARGGILTFVKGGYLGKSMPIDTKLPQETKAHEKRIEVKLDKLTEVTVGVQKKKFAKCFAGICYPGSNFPVIGTGVGWIFKPTPAYDLEDNEEAVVTLKRISDIDDDFSAAFTVKGTEEAVITLVPGFYEINIQLLLNEEVKIPAEIRCVEVKKGLFGEDEECYLINETVFEVFPSGGLNWENESYWELKPNNLYKANKITFLVPSIALDEVPETLRVIEDIEQISKVREGSKKYKNELSPKIS